MQRKNIVIAILLSLFINVIEASGFLAGTLVKTPHGYIPIEQLTINSTVCCKDRNGKPVTSHITHTKSHTVPECITITLDDCSITMAPNQRLYNTQQKKWIKAKNIHSKDIAITQSANPIAISVVHKTVTVYDITVAQHHNFYVTPHDLLAHNFIPIGLSLSFAFGGCA